MYSILVTLLNQETAWGKTWKFRCRESNLFRSTVNVGDYQNYVTKRMRCLGDLHSSLSTNLEKFSNLINECQSDYFKSDAYNFSKFSKKILSSINDLNVNIYTKSVNPRSSCNFTPRIAFLTIYRWYSTAQYHWETQTHWISDFWAAGRHQRWIKKKRRCVYIFH